MTSASSFLKGKVLYKELDLYRTLGNTDGGDLHLAERLIEETKKEYIHNSEYDKDLYSEFSDSEVHKLIDSLWDDYSHEEQSK